MEQLELTVNGMTCSACEQRIATALSRVEGVVRAIADHRTGQVRVVVDAGRVSEQTVRHTIERAGYEVSR